MIITRTAWWAIVRYSIKENQLFSFFDLFVNCRVVLLGPQRQRKLCKNYQPYQLPSLLQIIKYNCRYISGVQRSGGKTARETIAPGRNSHSARWKPFCSFVVCISSIKQYLFKNETLYFWSSRIFRFRGRKRQYADFHLKPDFCLLSCM